MRSTTARISRRQWTAMAGALVAGSELTTAAAQQPASTPRDYLAEQRASISRDVAALKEFEIGYADEPIFALVVK